MSFFANSVNEHHDAYESDKFAALLAATRDGGDRLPAQFAQAIGHYFDEDFTHVRVHCSLSADMFNAHALAVGDDVIFSPDAWRPDTRDGIRLLGHELAHVVQQRYLDRRVGGTNIGGEVLKCPGLEAQADLVGDDFAAMLCDGVSTIRGAGRKLLAGAGTRGTVRPLGSALVQLQEKGVVGASVFGGPDVNTPLRTGTVIFRQTASSNEVYRTRAGALERVKAKHNIGGTAQRTYYSNPAHLILPVNMGQGAKLRFMEDRDDPADSYGRYYDFGLGKLIVEHTHDPECRMIEITAVNPVNVAFRMWSMMEHFHMATYPVAGRPATSAKDKYVTAGLVQGLPDVNSAPPGYAQAVVHGHHVYHLEDVTRSVNGTHARLAFSNAFNAGAQTLFNLVWNW